jgi:FkbM family methyltransferase
LTYRLDEMTRLLARLKDFLPTPMRRTYWSLVIRSKDRLGTFGALWFARECLLLLGPRAICKTPRRTRLRVNDRTITLRRWTSDVLVAKEVLVDEAYVIAAQHLTTTSTVVDLGSNIGLSIIFFSFYAPKGRFIGVEPDRDNFRLLKDNTKELDTTLINAAVWPTDGWLAAARSNCERNAWGYRFIDDRASTTRTQVRAISLDSLFERVGTTFVDLLKIDIEGAEAEVFPRLEAFLRQVGTICIEFHQDSRQRSEFDQITARVGFTIVFSAKDADHELVVVSRRNGNASSETNTRGKALSYIAPFAPL